MFTSKIKSIKNLGVRVPMFDLSVKNTRCYYANDILVHNSDPSSNSLPKEFRKYVIPDENYKFIFYDWKAAELMVAAFWAKEKWMIDAYLSGKDMHREITSLLLEKKVGEITDAEREISKIITFSVIYGSEGGAAARALKISMNEASALVQRFWEIAPNIMKLRNEIISGCFMTGYTKTITGRRRRLPLIFSKIEEEKKGAIRQAFNSAIQGSVADLQKKHIHDLSSFIEKEYDGNFVTTVFDSFLIQVPKPIPICDIVQLIESGSKWKINNCEVSLLFKIKEGFNYYDISK